MKGYKPNAKLGVATAKFGTQVRIDGKKINLEPGQLLRCFTLSLAIVIFY
ncbi:hypothetical protein [Chroogloeocystis siderophila]|jgi:hypothetical protein|nr:hypothetical protein [Chroogloeocystis siderophila]